MWVYSCRQCGFLIIVGRPVRVPVGPRPANQSGQSVEPVGTHPTLGGAYRNAVRHGNLSQRRAVFKVRLQHVEAGQRG